MFVYVMFCVYMYKYKYVHLELTLRQNILFYKYLNMYIPTYYILIHLHLYILYITYSYRLSVV